MLRWIVAIAFFISVTGFAYLASAQGWGLPGLLEKPVSIRQSSTKAGSGHRGPMFIYFGSLRHYGGGFRGGK